MIDDARLRSLGVPAELSDRITTDMSARDASDDRRSCVECSKIKRVDFCTSRKQKPVFLLQRCPDFTEAL